MSGRAVEIIDVNPDNPTEFYVCICFQGIVLSPIITDNHFEPLFDNEDVITIGDIAVDWKTRKYGLVQVEMKQQPKFICMRNRGIYVECRFW